jgi:hypothetical protein
MLKETAEYRFIKIKLKIKKMLGNTERQEDLFILFHKQSEPANYLNPKQQRLLELRKTWEPKFSSKEKENILKKKSKTQNTRVVHNQPAYVHRLYIMQNTYVRVLYREQGTYTSVNFQKKENVWTNNLGKGSW